MKYIGLDIGTTSICGVVFDAGLGEILSTAAETNRAARDGAYPWERLQDPEAIWLQAEAVMRQLQLEHPDISGIGVTGQMHGILYLDELGSAVSPLYTWQDQRGAERLTQQTYAERLSELTGYTLSTGYGVVTHFFNWMNHLIPSSACRVCTIPDYIVIKLTGRQNPLMDPTHAAGIGCYSLQKQDFDAEAMEQAGINRSWFPSVRASGTMAGSTSGGIPVFVSLGDNQASFLGSVKDIHRTVLLNIGTGGQLSIHEPMNGPDVPEGLEARPFPGGGRLLVGSSLCGGKAYAILEQFFRKVIVSYTGEPVSAGQVYAWMERLAAEDSACGGDSLSVNTQFLGTRQEPDRRGQIGGISVDNFLPELLVVGFLRGMVEELHAYFERLPRTIRHNVTSLVGAGNAIRSNDRLRDEAARQFGLPMHVPTHSEEGAVGAALTAAVGSGEVDSFETAGQRLG
ncbi:sedoheptulokinase [Paenibacillus sp. Dod16]|uniref:sedoheptulokinase n=1 Tax=Paenibacillus sp. Dod16 TaxID=3416392 RepID=UPI003CEB093F